MKTKKALLKKLFFTLLVLPMAFNFSVLAQDVNQLLLKDYHPVSIYKIPVTHVDKAIYPVIDIHSHDYAKTDEDVTQWVKNMDACGIQKTIILSGNTGDKFDATIKKYARFSDRFDIWCGFDYTGFDKPGYGSVAVKELERCFKMGAKGVGELSDKGFGAGYSALQPDKVMHFDDPRMSPLFKKCAELHLPINIHVADPIWMYEKMDANNDGLMNAETWKIDSSKPGIYGFDALIQTLENVVKNNPKTTFIACHFANLNHDIRKLGEMLDKYSNLYADISARYAESATIPRTMDAFYEKYQDRLLYGTDMGYDSPMYRITFRILETNDEHFYEAGISTYHWAMNGFGLRKEVLQKLYNGNAAGILKKSL